MNICFVSTYSSTNNGGATFSMFNIGNELVNRGHRVSIILNSNLNLDKIDYNPKIEIILSPQYSMRVSKHKENILTKYKFLLKSWANIWFQHNLTRILSKREIDIIHINGLDSSIAAQTAKKLGIPYVWHIRQLLDEDFNMYLFEEEKIFQLLNQSQKVIAISETVKDRFQDKVRNIDVIYNGVPLEKYYIQKRDIISRHRINIMIAGRIDLGKGQFDAIKAVQILLEKKHDVHLYIIGSIENHSYYVDIYEYISNNGLDKEITIYDHVTDLSEIRELCDIGLTCSKMEAFGRVTIENQMAGLITIGANSGGTKEIIKDNETGFLYETNNPQDLAQKIENVILNPNKSRKVAEMGQKDSLKRFSIINVVNELEKIYKEILMESRDIID